jgi:hypothetical protein
VIILVRRFLLSPRGFAFILMGLCADPGLSFAQTTFQRAYGGPNDEIGYSVQQTTDGGYIIVGSTTSFGSGASDVYLVKTDSSGDTVWTRTYGGSNAEIGYSVQQTTDGGYIIAGNTLSFGSGGSDVYLVKTNSSGDTLWTRTFGSPYGEWGYSVQQTSDGGYIIAGAIYYGMGIGDVYLVKTNSSGYTLWTKTYGGPSRNVFNSVQQTTDGGYIIAGWTYSFSSNTGQVYLVKTNSSGDTLWTRTYGGAKDETGSSVRQSSDGGYIIAGSTASFGSGLSDMYLVKTNSSGDTLWTRAYGGRSNDEGLSVQQTSDGGYIVSGSTVSFGSGLSDMYLVKTNSLGDTLWTRTFGGANDEIGYSVQQTTDGGYIIVGSTRSSNLDMYLVKTQTEGLAVPVRNDRDILPVKIALLQNYPNPFNPSTTIKYELPKATEVRLSVYDILGREVSVLVNEKKEAGVHEVKFDGSNLSSGVYFYRLSVSPLARRDLVPTDGRDGQAGDFTQTKRLLLLK